MVTCPTLSQPLALAGSLAARLTCGRPSGRVLHPPLVARAPLSARHEGAPQLSEAHAALPESTFAMRAALTASVSGLGSSCSS